MWNPFSSASSKPRDGETSETPDPALPLQRSELTPLSSELENDATREEIAEIEIMGVTAVATLTVTDLTQEDGAEQLADLLEEMAQTGAVYFVLDMQAVQMMDTTCLGCMVEALNNLASRGGRIALASPNHNVHYVFRLTRLDRVFNICSDVPAALKIVEQSREAG